MNYGSEALKKAVIPDVLAGKKFIALAISEAFAGSDVAGLRCTAKKTPVCLTFDRRLYTRLAIDLPALSQDGKHYIVNGTKKVSFNL